MGNIRFIILSLMVVLLAACETDDFDRKAPEPFDGTYYLTLKVSVDNRGTRAGDSPWGTSRADDPNPWGGEGGNNVSDAERQAVENEGKVYDALVLLYKKVEEGSADDLRDIENNPENTPIEYALEFTFPLTGNNGGVWTSDKVKMPAELVKDESKFGVITLVNLDADVKAALKERVTNTKANTATDAEKIDLKKVIDYVYPKKPWTETTSGGTTTYDRFVMTSEMESDFFQIKDGKDNSGGKGSTNDPYLIGQINVRRLAARIDIVPLVDDALTLWKSEGYVPNYIQQAYEAEEIDEEDINRFKLPSDGYFFRVYGSETNEDTRCRFLLTGIQIDNDPTADYGTYIIKRSTVSASDMDTQYFGTNKIFGEEYKTSDNGAGNWVIDPHGWAKKNGTATTANYEAWYQAIHDVAFVGNKGKGDSFRAAYTMENVTLDNKKSEHSTAIIFKGKFLKATSSNGSNWEYTPWADQSYRFILRHSDPTGKGVSSLPMLFSVVRNNIYRIRIAKVLTDEFNPAIVIEYYDPNKNEVEMTIPLERDVDDVTDSWSSTTYPTDAPRRR